MTVYYKWLLPDYVTPVQKKKWPVAVGEWTPKERLSLCRSGWHGVEEKHVLNHLPDVFGAELWEVEVKGEILHGDDKFCAEQMRLLWRVGVTTEANLRLFACDVAEDVLPLFEKVLPNDRRPRNAIEVARKFANGQATARERAATWAAVWAATRDAAWDARDATRAARAAARAKYSNWFVVRIESGY